jgi:hypothetical protein
LILVQPLVPAEPVGGHLEGLGEPVHRQRRRAHRRAVPLGDGGRLPGQPIEELELGGELGGRRSVEDAVRAHHRLERFDALLVAVLEPLERALVDRAVGVDLDPELSEALHVGALLEGAGGGRDAEVAHDQAASPTNSV